MTSSSSSSISFSNSDSTSSASSSSTSSATPTPLSPSTNPDPSSISTDSWAKAEETAHKILLLIRPTLETEQKRQKIIDYIQRLARYCLGCEVCPYGSVPLRAYLPDGDIDLTALSVPKSDVALASDLCAILEGEALNETAEYEVKDVRFIDAEVKLVKCIVQNIVVDISFNQLGGLSTLCFLEQVDRVVGKNHLFKRSIILIKSWCYYESRTLGAHHGLVSTYGLETLVLYIIHIFHSSLDGPVAVLYRFLDYFGRLDWENYCISLRGPVIKSSMPNLVAEDPENGGADLLLSEEFLKSCLDAYSIPPININADGLSFNLKHLNIIDPLRRSNNLGRSVSKGNYYRICSAFRLGARELGLILSSPREKIPDKLNRFFANTLDRHGTKCGADSLPLRSAKCSEGKKLRAERMPVIFYKLSIPSQAESEGDPFPCGDADHVKSLFLKIDPVKGSGHSVLGGGLCVSVVGKTKNHRKFENFSRGYQKSTEKSLVDLSGDYDIHVRNLVYGLYCQGYATPGHMSHNPPHPPSHPEKKNPWKNLHKSFDKRGNFHPQRDAGSAAPRSPALFSSQTPVDTNSEGWEACDVGAYFPNMSCRQYMQRSWVGSGRHRGHCQSRRHRHQHHNNLGASPLEKKLGVISPEFFEAETPVLGNLWLGSPPIAKFQLAQWEPSIAKELSSSPYKMELGPFGHLRKEKILSEGTTIARPQAFASSPAVALATQDLKPVSEVVTERIKVQSYRLADEVDFPPLSV